MLKAADHFGYYFIIFTSFSVSLLNICSSLPFPNVSVNEADFSPATATWYGDPTGAGSGKFHTLTITQNIDQYFKIYINNVQLEVHVDIEMM